MQKTVGQSEWHRGLEKLKFALSTEGMRGWPRAKQPCSTFRATTYRQAFHSEVFVWGHLGQCPAAGVTEEFPDGLKLFPKDADFSASNARIFGQMISENRQIHGASNCGGGEPNSVQAEAPCRKADRLRDGVVHRFRDIGRRYSQIS